jgi:hypothetical protein
MRRRTVFQLFLLTSTPLNNLLSSLQSLLDPLPLWMELWRPSTISVPGSVLSPL